MSSRRGHVKRDGEKGDGDKQGSMGTPGAKKKRGTVRDDDSDDSSCSDDDVLVDHLVGEVANEDDAMCIICGHGDSEVRHSSLPLLGSPRCRESNETWWSLCVAHPWLKKQGGGHLKVPNEIVCCEKCGMWVHQSCYSIKTIPEGEWLCWPCRDQLDPDAIKCAVCPVRKGAFKKTTCGQWCHMVCAHWMPEISVLVRLLARPTFNPPPSCHLSLASAASLHGCQQLMCELPDQFRIASTPHLANVLGDACRTRTRTSRLTAWATFPRSGGRWSATCASARRAHAYSATTVTASRRSIRCAHDLPV